MFDFFTGEDHASISSDLGWLNSYQSPKNNRWFYNNLNLRSGKGSDMYSYIRSRTPFIMGNTSYFGLCSVNDSPYPECGKESVFKNNIDSPTLINGLPGPFSLWIPYVDLKNNGIKGGILLSKGGALPVNGMEDMIAVFNGRVPNDLDDSSLRIYRIAHLIGMSAASDKIRLQKAPYSRCSNGITTFKCQKNNVGFFSVTGLLLRDMTVDCNNCKAKSKLVLNYYASSYLLRSVNDMRLVRAGYKLFSKYERSFNEAGMDSESLKKIYRQNLLN